MVRGRIGVGLFMVVLAGAGNTQELGFEPNLGLAEAKRKLLRGTRDPFVKRIYDLTYEDKEFSVSFYDDKNPQAVHEAHYAGKKKIRIPRSKFEGSATYREKLDIVYRSMAHELVHMFFDKVHRGEITLVPCGPAGKRLRLLLHPGPE